MKHKSVMAEPVEANHEIWYRCHVCGQMYDLRTCTSYCPNCGAKSKGFLNRFIYPLAIAAFLILIKIL